MYYHTVIKDLNVHHIVGDCVRNLTVFEVFDLDKTHYRIVKHKNKPVAFADVPKEKYSELKTDWKNRSVRFKAIEELFAENEKALTV